MKFAVIGDVHWSTYSSIVRGRGEKYSKRLENLIDTINWCESEAEKRKVDAVVYLGDFFDKAELTSEEITALKEINWSNRNNLGKTEHLFLVGNHEIGLHDNSFSTCELFGLLFSEVMDKPMTIKASNGTVMGFLPYVSESDRLPLTELFPDRCDVIFSHNDLICQYGMYKSTVGYDPADIEKVCGLFINGHIHNYNEMGNIINLGNITGQNFSEDGTVYPHHMMFLDTVEKSVEFVENPHALYFYKVDFDGSDYEPFDNHSVVTVKCSLENVEKAKALVANALASRIVITRDEAVSDVSITELQTVDHLQKFAEFVHQTVGTSEAVDEELKRVLA